MHSFWTCLQNVTTFGVLGNRLLNFSFWDMLTNFTFLFERKLAPFGTVLFYIIGQVLGRAYGTGRSHARSPAFATGLKLVGGSAPKPLAYYSH